MLHRYINQFLEYCQLADFLVRSIQALAARLNEFEACLKSQKIRSIKRSHTHDRGRCLLIILMLFCPLKTLV